MSWKCGNCETLNDDIADICCVCGEPRAEKPKKRKGARPWICSFCLTNNTAEEDVCCVCGLPRSEGREIEETIVPEPVSEPTPRPTPRPEPRPTPRPEPRPTPRPTPRPEPRRTYGYTSYDPEPRRRRRRVSVDLSSIEAVHVVTTLLMLLFFAAGQALVYWQFATDGDVFAVNKLIEMTFVRPVSSPVILAVLIVSSLCGLAAMISAEVFITRINSEYCDGYHIVLFCGEFCVLMIVCPVFCAPALLVFYSVAAALAKKHEIIGQVTAVFTVLCIATAIGVPSAASDYKDVYVLTLSSNYDGGETQYVRVGVGEEMPEIDLPEREGYEFLGYFEYPLGGTQYYDENTLSAREWDKGGNAVLYAHWEKALRVVYFDKRGGTGGTEQANISAFGALPDATAPEREGYEFLGYFTMPYGGEMIYDQNMDHDGYLHDEGSLTVYAQWRKS